MNRVYAAQEPMVKNPRGEWEPNATMDMSDASRYGELIFVWAPGAAAFARAHLERRALEIADRFNEERDWVINVGSPTLLSILAWAIGYRGKKLRVLEWDRRTRQYHPTTTERE